MLPKLKRLAKADLSPKTRPHFLQTPYFALKYWENSLMYNRFGFIISKKIDKRAVIRNGLKRKMSDVVTALPKQQQTYDMVFSMKKAAVEATEKELETAIVEIKA